MPSIRLGFINYPGLTAEGSFLESLKGNPGFDAYSSEIKPRWQRVVDWERASVAVVSP